MSWQAKKLVITRYTFCYVLLLGIFSSLSAIVFSQELTNHQGLVSAKTLTKTPQNIFYQENGPGKARAILSNPVILQTALLSDQPSIIIAVPLPTGEFVNFILTPENIMAEGLAKKYPNIRTFSGVAVNDATSTGRFDITPNGFHAMFYYQGERIFVEPDNAYMQTQSLVKNMKPIIIPKKGTALEAEKEPVQKPVRLFDSTIHEYKSYIKAGSHLSRNVMRKFHQPKNITQEYHALQSLKQQKARRVTKTENTIKTYRIAISAAAEYTLFNGGTVDSAMAEIITLVNRLNQVYQQDLAIKLELVENNNLLVFTNTSSDPFKNNSDDGEINTGIIDGIIGSDNYDIGHVLNTDGGGLAVLGSVCHPIYKGDGVTGDAFPINDAFYIDYVAHEIGHQFGATHSFNGTAGACADNRVARSAYEVGSGSTIMSYAGICDDQNLQINSDAFFHAISIDQITSYVQHGIGSYCGITMDTTNQAAVVDAGLDYIIPARTPFALSGSAQDPENDTLHYSWQQFDLGEKSASYAEQIDDGTRPLFRAFLPSNDAIRYFPQLSDVLTGANTIGESLPTTNRELNFRLMVFDKKGGVSFDDTKITVIDSGKAFALNTPSPEIVWRENNNNIRWQVADTNMAPINCSAVDVLLSRNNGTSFDIMLADNIANNGNSNISLAGFCANEVNTSQARIKLVCRDNIFYAINDGIFSIDKDLSANDIFITSQQPISLAQGKSIELTRALFSYACEIADSVAVQAGDNYTVVEQTITPNNDFTGELLVPIIASKDNTSSAVYLVKIIVESAPEPELSPMPDTVKTKSAGSFYWLLCPLFFLFLYQIRRDTY